MDVNDLTALADFMDRLQQASVETGVTFRGGVYVKIGKTVLMLDVKKRSGEPDDWWLEARETSR